MSIISIQLNSQCSFYDMCTKKKIKLESRIPQTIIFDKSAPKTWFFNPKKTKIPEVYKKNQDKLNTIEIVKSLFKLNNNCKFEVLSQFLDLIKSNNLDEDITPIAIAQMKRNEVIPMSRADLLSFFMEGKELSSVSYIQEYIKQPKHKNDVYFIEYKQDMDFLSTHFKFFKKSLTTKSQVVLKNIVTPNPFTPLLKQTSGAQIKKQVPETIQTLVKFMDSNLNMRFQEEVKKIVLFIEKAYQVKVRKLVAKFILDETENVYFLGLKDLFIDFGQKSPYHQGMREELQSNGRFENFLIACKQFKKRGSVDDSIQQMPREIVEEDKKLSKTLFKHMILEQCSGDFCKYKLIEKNKGPLQLRKGLLDQYKNVFKESNSTLINKMTKLPYEISNQIIIRTRDNYQEVIELFQKYKIYLENCNPEEHPELTLEQQYPFIKYNTDIQAIINLYKSVKICSNCFIIYQMIQKHFESQLSKDLKSGMQFINQKMQTTNKLSDNISRAQTTQSGRFRINKNPQQKKNFLITVRSPTNSEQKVPKTASPKKQREHCSQIEINRLSLGYLNYQKLDQFYKPQQQEVVIRHRLSESQHNNLIAMLARVKAPLAKRIDQNNNETKELQVRNEDVKALMIKEGIDIRQAQKEYYLQRLKSEDKPYLMYTQSYYYYNVNLDIVRGICQYQISTPMNALSYDLQYDKLRSLDIMEVCSIMGYPKPPYDISELEYLVVDQQTAIPYALYESVITVQRSKTRDIRGNNQSSGIDLIIIMHDMFESLFEYYTLIAEYVNDFQNKRILMFNTPGQAYTIYQKDKEYTNIYISQILDSILFELNQSKRIDIQTDSIKLVGIGSGGFHAQSFIVQSQQTFPIQQLIFINSFNSIYTQLSTFFTSSIQIFEEQPKDMPELSFEYVNTIFNTKMYDEDQLSSILSINPINIQGRIVILNGLLNSPSFIERLQKLILSINVYHSVKNCFIRVQEAEQLSMFIQDETLDVNNVVISKKIQNSKRTLQFIEGGHAILQENEQALNDILLKLFT